MMESRANFKPVFRDENQHRQTSPAQGPLYHNHPRRAPDDPHCCSSITLSTESKGDEIYIFWVQNGHGAEKKDTIIAA